MINFYVLRLLDVEICVNTIIIQPTSSRTHTQTEGVDEFMAQMENSEALAVLFVFPVRSLEEFLLSVPKRFVLFLSA